MTSRFLRLAVVLGLITAVGPFAIDMYLPALPSMGRSLGADPAHVQATLMAFFVTIGVCQLFYGPLSDMLGRKLPIYAGLAIFITGSVGCAFAPDMNMLILFRVVQAFGACAGMVVPRAIVRDLHTGHDATRLMSLLMLVVSVSPLLAPMTGSFIIEAWGWRAVFLVLTGAGLLALLLAATQLAETRSAEQRTGSSWGGAFAAYRELAADPEFVGLTLVGTLGISAFFIYLGSGAFVLISYYGLTPKEFSLCFALNAGSFFGFSQLTGRLTRRYGLIRVIRAAVAGFALVLTALALLTVVRIPGLVTMMAFLFAGYGFLGLVLPTTAVLSLERHGAVAGTASALMGSIQMVAGSAIMALDGLFADGTPRPMLLGIAATALASFAMAQFALHHAQKALPAP